MKRAGVGLAVLVALLVAPAQSGARGLPDLKPTSVRALSSQVAPGSLFRVRDRVLNAGRARSRSFTMRYLLSRDRRRGRDLTLRGGRRVGRLRARRSSTRSTRVRVPAGTPAGRWWVLACADPRRRIRERRERNNCRASVRRVLVAAPAAAGAPAPACRPPPAARVPGRAGRHPGRRGG